MADHSIMLPQWKQRRQKRLIITSATQFESWERCHRYWWFDKVRQLPQPMGVPQVFGTVLHGVAERYLKADDSGRSTNGSPVELYPKGWEQARNRFTNEVDGVVSLGEQAQIKKLIETAISEGVLERRPQRAIEREFRHTVLELEGDTHVQIMGFIDLEFHGEVHDHKTTKSMRWAKSPAKLKINTQMLIYAKMHLLLLAERGAAIPAKITLRHNVYCKDPGNPVVRKTEVTVTVAEIEAKWAEIEHYAQNMVALRDNAEDGLADISDPPDPSYSCNAFGGCPYMTICSGQESALGYENRLDKAKSVVQTKSTRPTPIVAKQKGSAMSFAAKLAAKKAATAAAGGNTQAPTVVPSPVAATPPAAVPPSAAQVEAGAGGDHDPANGMVSPPWANPKCVACGGCGFNSKGNPCTICSATAVKHGKTPAGKFHVQANDDGTVAWVQVDDDSVCGISPLQGYEATTKMQTREAPPAAPVAVAAPAPPTADPVAEAVSTITAAEEAKGKGRPKKSFTLCINCGPLKRGNDRKGSGRHIIYLSELFVGLGEQMAKAAGVESFYEISAFARRDQLRQHGAAICDDFGTDIVVAEGIGTGETDMKALCDGIRPFAGLVLAPCVI